MSIIISGQKCTLEAQKITDAVNVLSKLFSLSKGRFSSFEEFLYNAYFAQNDRTVREALLQIAQEAKYRTIALSPTYGKVIKDFIENCLM